MIHAIDKGRALKSLVHKNNVQVVAYEYVPSHKHSALFSHELLIRIDKTQLRLEHPEKSKNREN